MATKAWSVEIDGTTYYIELDHHTVTGKRTITADDDGVVDKGMSAKFGETIPFEVAAHPAALEISTSGFTWEYALKGDNRVVPQL